MRRREAERRGILKWWELMGFDVLVWVGFWRIFWFGFGWSGRIRTTLEKMKREKEEIERGERVLYIRRQKWKHVFVLHRFGVVLV